MRTVDVMTEMSTLCVCICLCSMLMHWVCEFKNAREVFVREILSYSLAVSVISDAVLNASHNSISVCRDLAALRSERMHTHV